MTHVSSVEPSHADTSTIYVALDNHRRGDFKPYVFVVERFRKDVPVDRVEPAERLAGKRLRDPRGSGQPEPVVRRYRDGSIRIA